MKNAVFINMLVAAVVAAVAVVLLLPHPPKPAPKQESVYERILRTGTIRCGYATYDPILTKDANGQLHGVFFDLINQMGTELGLKVEWTTEVGYGDIEAAYAAKKFDLFCSGVAPTPKRAKYGLFSQPLYYFGLVTWVRGNDHRFDQDLAKLNDPNVKIAVRDGDLTDMVVDSDYPLAKKVSSPQLEDYTQMLTDVKEGKADATFFEPLFGNRFLEKNPGSVRMLFPEHPVFFAPVTLMLPPNEPQLLSMVNVTLDKMRLNGDVTRALEKNAGGAKNFWLVPAPVKP